MIPITKINKQNIIATILFNQLSAINKLTVVLGTLVIVSEVCSYVVMFFVIFFFERERCFTGSDTSMSIGFIYFALKIILGSSFHKTFG